MSRFPLAILVFFMTAGLGLAQQQAPTRVTFRMGLGYDQGDFGTGETSRAAYLPVSVRFAAKASGSSMVCRLKPVTAFLCRSPE